MTKAITDQIWTDKVIALHTYLKYLAKSTSYMTTLAAKKQKKAKKKQKKKPSEIDLVFALWTTCNIQQIIDAM